MNGFTSSAETVDVLVVGAGPAGAAAATHLARHGVDVLAVDKAAFPREKVCGDGLTPRGVKQLLELGVDVEQPGFMRIQGLRSFGPGVRIELPWPESDSFPSFGVVRTRHDLDDLLIRNAEKAGAIVWQETEAERPILDRPGRVVGAVVRRGEGEPREIRARHVIASDGASSRFAQQTRVRRDPSRPIGIAARRYFRSPLADRPYFLSWLDLEHEGVNLPGYGWIFPVGDGTVNVGAGLLNTARDFRHLSAKKVYEVFVRHLPEEVGVTEEHAEGRLLSGPLPMGMNRAPLALPGLLVAGDAGGIINPFNGEGIAYAMESGRLAAELIHEALVLDRPALAQIYPAMLRERYGRYFAMGRAFVRAIGSPTVMRTAVRYGLPRERLMRFLLRLMANLTDGRGGDLDERLIHVLTRLAPSR